MSLINTSQKRKGTELAERQAALDNRNKELDAKQDKLRAQDETLREREQELEEQKELDEFWRCLCEIDAVTGEGDLKTESLRTRAAEALKEHLNRNERKIRRLAGEESDKEAEEISEKVRRIANAIGVGRNADRRRADLRELAQRLEKKPAQRQKGRMT